MSGFLSVIREELENKEFRDAYVAENARRGLAYQVTALREARGWSRAEFARQANKPQSNISRWEDPTYGKFSVSTLIEIASIFDVALSVKFVSFGDLLTSVSSLRPEKLAALSYEAERQRAGQNPVGASALAAFAAPPQQPPTSDFGKLLSDTRAGSPLPPLSHTSATPAPMPKAMESVI